MADLNKVINESFVQYAGAVLQSRALVDVRDGLKPSARQILYCMQMCKYTADKPFQSTAAVVGDAMKYFYIHGDASCEGIIMRASQPFAMRYPLVDVGGSNGTLIASGSWAASRYTKSRLSKLSAFFFQDIKKDTIADWRDSDTFGAEVKYPSVMPSKGFYNIVNGTSGIGIGMASSVPQYNLRELNNAIITLIDNPESTFDEIYCAPDFATGAILYNEAEVKESMKNGTGFACKLRSVVSWDNTDRCFVISEIPYGVYTNTICGQLEEICNSDNNPGIERFIDLTGEKPLLKIYLAKKANPDAILNFLFKNTALQSYYGINFTMLDHGRYPKVFTWKEMLQAYIDHQIEVYTRGFKYDLKEIEYRIHIINGLLICMASIDEVVKTIKNSASAAAASNELQSKFLLDCDQAKAVLDMKLSRLAHLEVTKLENEKENLQTEEARIKAILESDSLLKAEIKKDLTNVAAKFGDDRRTKIMNLVENNDEPIEEKQLVITFTSAGATYTHETSSLYVQRRNGVGTKFKLASDEYIVDSVIGLNTDTIMFFTDKGNFYHMPMSNFEIDTTQYISSYINIRPDEHIVAASIAERKVDNIIFITEKGILKKSLLSEYNLKRNAGASAIKLSDGDKIVSVIFTNNEKIGIATRRSNFIMIDTSLIRAIGRTAQGIIGIKLNDGDEVVAAHAIPDSTNCIISVSTDGYIKRSSINEFSIVGRATKGSSIHDTNSLSDFMPIINDSDILVNSTHAQICISLNDIPLLSRSARGVKSIKLAANSTIKNLSAV